MGFATDTQPSSPPRLVVQDHSQSERYSVAWSPTDNVFATFYHKYINIWNPVHARQILTVQHGEYINQVVFSPSGRLFASSSKTFSAYNREEKTIKIFDVFSGESIKTLQDTGGQIIGMTFVSGDDRLLTWAKNGLIQLLELPTGRPIRSYHHNSFGGDTKFLQLKASPDGKAIILLTETLGENKKNTITIFNTSTGNIVKSIPLGTAAEEFYISPDGKTIITTQRIDAYTSSITKLSLPDGKISRKINTWSIRQLVFNRGNNLANVAFLQGGLSEIDLNTGKTTYTTNQLPEKKWNISPSGRLAVSIDKSNLQILDIQERRLYNAADLLSKLAHPAKLEPNGNIFSVDSYGNAEKVWNPINGNIQRLALGKTGKASWGNDAIKFSDDGKFVAAGGEDRCIHSWEVKTGNKIFERCNVDWIKALEFSHDGKWLAAMTRPTLELINIATGDRKISIPVQIWVSALAFSPNDELLAVGDYDERHAETLTLWNTTSAQKVASLTGGGVHSLMFDSTGAILIASRDGGVIEFWDIATKQLIKTLQGYGPAISSDRKLLVAHSGNDFGEIKVWDVASGLEIGTIKPPSDQSVSGELAILTQNSGNMVVEASGGVVRYWRLRDGALLATASLYNDGHWAIADPEGRFDVDDLSRSPYINWVTSDDPLTPLPLEIFMRNYYEPSLLARSLSGEKFRPVQALSEINKTQPEVRIDAIDVNRDNPSEITVSVSAVGKIGTQPTAHRNNKATKVHDLRLFRNGQLVGHADGQLTGDEKETAKKAFKIRLSSGTNPIELSAYAFNDDGVKSTTARKTYVPSGKVKGTTPRAYIIAVGVNHHENPAWNLRYAANDARLIGQLLSKRLSSQQRYDEVVHISLLSDTEGARLATKANIKAVLDTLAGRKADVTNIPNGELLRPAKPDDVVVISFAGHGYEDGGTFYLIPSDTGPGEDRSITPDLKIQSISSDELSLWFQDIDAGDIAMIVDACHSAATVGDTFKPGPMGSRGLGQMAFDKGMQLLAASQADGVALESDLIQQGLLSYALTQEGMEWYQADYKPTDQKITLDEWLSFGASRVPTLAEEVRNGKVMAPRGSDDRGRIVRISTREPIAKRRLQQPTLFDFRKGRAELILDSKTR